MQALVDVILPVFLVIGAGYLVVWRKWLSDGAVDGLMLFAQGFAIPVLLFLNIARLDLGASFDWRLLVSFYTGAGAGFFAGLFGARYLFGRDWEDAVAIGFVCLFSNSLLLGLPLTERAYGPDALGPNYAIISVHAPFCYILGIAAMEIARAKGAGFGATSRLIGRSVLTNPLVIGIALGFAVNLTGAPVPGAMWDALDLIARAGLPTALFGLGGVLYRYRPEGDMRTILFASAVALVLHPLITWTMGKGLGLDQGPFRSAVLTAAMAPGVNAYVFSNIYGRARRVVASTVLISTGLCVLTAWVWMTLLG
jgi:malonate transporter